MKLLLDTHIWLWALLDPDKLSRKVRAAIENRSNELWLSAISIWECVVLAEKGRLLLREPFDHWFAQSMTALPIHEAPLTFEIAPATREAGLPHRDPADRFLAATAKVFELTLVTADQRLWSAKGISVLPNS